MTLFFYGRHFLTFSLILLFWIYLKASNQQIKKESLIFLIYCEIRSHFLSCINSIVAKMAWQKKKAWRTKVHWPIAKKWQKFMKSLTVPFGPTYISFESRHHSPFLMVAFLTYFRGYNNFLSVTPSFLSRLHSSVTPSQIHLSIFKALCEILKCHYWQIIR
jgi:hypothetical protein